MARWSVGRTFSRTGWPCRSTTAAARSASWSRRIELTTADSPNIFRARSHELLGNTLVAQRKFEEAEPLLLHAYETSKLDRRRLQRGFINSLVLLYQAWNKPDQAASWRRTREQYDRADPGAEPATMPAATRPST